MKKKKNDCRSFHTVIEEFALISIYSFQKKKPPNDVNRRLFGCRKEPSQLREGISYAA